MGAYLVEAELLEGLEVVLVKGGLLADVVAARLHELGEDDGADGRHKRRVSERERAARKSESARVFYQPTGQVLGMSWPLGQLRPCSSQHDSCTSVT